MRQLLQLSLIILTISFIASCAIFNRGPKTDKRSQEIITSAVMASGGANTLSILDKISYLKKVRLLDKTGSQESEIFEIHNYNLVDDTGKIEWIDNSVRSKLSFKGDLVEYSKNAQYDTTSMDFWQEKRLASQKYLLLPWKLDDPAAVATYRGTTTLVDSTIVNVLEVIYPNVTDITTPEWYYFNTKSNRLEGYMIKKGGNFSFIKNVETVDFKGLILPTKRVSYRVDSLRNIQYTLAEYEYYNYR